MLRAMQCMLTKTSPMQRDWEFFYDEIQGFDCQPGFEYALEVAVYEVELPAQDGRSASPSPRWPARSWCAS